MCSSLLLFKTKIEQCLYYTGYGFRQLYFRRRTHNHNSAEDYVNSVKSMTNWNKRIAKVTRHT